MRSKRTILQQQTRTLMPEMQTLVMVTAVKKQLQTMEMLLPKTVSKPETKRVPTTAVLRLVPKEVRPGTLKRITPKKEMLKKQSRTQPPKKLVRTTPLTIIKDVPRD